MQGINTTSLIAAGHTSKRLLVVSKVVDDKIVSEFLIEDLTGDTKQRTQSLVEALEIYNI